MVRRQVRRNKQVVNEPEYEEPRLPVYEQIKNATLKAIEEAGDYGCTARELGGKLSNIDPRRIREATAALKGSGKIKVVDCRCGSTPIYVSALL